MIKSLHQYIIETKKTYHFRIKFADCKVDDSFKTKLEDALKTYDVVSVDGPKHEPIQLVHPDFPKMGSVDVYSVDIAINYPANDSTIRNLLNQKMGVPFDHMMVLNKHQVDANIDYSEIARRKTPALTDPNLEQAEGDAQDLVGEKRVDGIKKNIPTREYEFDASDIPNKNRTQTTNDLPMGDTSPIGTHQNEIPNPFKNRKK
jgi:hypothetical protein